MMQQDGKNTAQFASKLIGDEGTKNLVINFFIVFSRFEFALKRSGFLKGKTQKKDKRPEPDWDRLANEISPKFSTDVSPGLKAAVFHLITHPPKEQIVVNNNLSWLDLTQGSGAKKCRWILRTIQTVRNNLFHYDQITLKRSEYNESIIGARKGKQGL